MVFLITALLSQAHTNYLLSVHSTVSRKPILNPHPDSARILKAPHYSPFRYPGGKTWLVPRLRGWLTTQSTRPGRPERIIEPFAGGGTASLVAILENYVDQAILSELDPRIAAVWQAILSDGPELSERILGFSMTEASVDAVLTSTASTCLDRAFQTIILNRVQHGGRMSPGSGRLRFGDRGKGVLSRWYPETLSVRIRRIYAHRDRIQFIEGDGLALIGAQTADPGALFFVDPPYTVGGTGKNAGRKLYAHHELDHARLFELMRQVRGAFLMTYDDDGAVREMALHHGFIVERVPMRNTHHNTVFELLIERAKTPYPADLDTIAYTVREPSDEFCLNVV